VNLAKAERLHLLLVLALGRNLGLVGVPCALGLVLARQNLGVVSGADVPNHVHELPSAQCQSAPNSTHRHTAHGSAQKCWTTA